MKNMNTTKITTKTNSTNKMVHQSYPESAGEKTETMITIFTPTYNRAEFLAPLYDSIKNQSSKDF